jgi:2-polyprenyl-3-methyl-5-hydroxy-6-metoxy-1,4-benzoquinol methylase
MKSTSQRLFERYNTLSRRPLISDARMKRIVFKSLNRVIGPWLPGERSAMILDVGCGEGALLAFLRTRGFQNLHGFDISPENVTLCHQLGLEFVEQFDALRIGQWKGSDSYDAIYVMDLIEHLPKEVAAEFVEQTRRRLRPGGFLVLQSPNMGCVFGNYHRHYDLSHRFALTEKTAIDLLMIAGFPLSKIELRPCWNATTNLGYLRELYLRLLHRMIFLAEDSSRPRIPSKNLLIRASQ